MKPLPPGVWQTHVDKFDIQLNQGFRHERGLCEGFALCEVKVESYIWERTRNICIEYRHNGKLSGIATTGATMWMHGLANEQGEVLVWLGIPVERLKRLARRAIKEKRVHRNAGDKGLSHVALVPIAWLTDPSCK